MSLDGSETTLVPWSVVWVTLIVSFFVGIAFFVFFLCNKAKASNHWVYQRKPLANNNDDPDNGPNSDRDTTRWTTRWFGWAKEAYSISDDEALENMGLDCFMFCRVLRFGCQLTLCGSILSIVLIPVYGSDTSVEGDHTEQFNQITLANVPAGSRKMWISAIAFCIFSWFSMYTLWKEWKHTYAPNRYYFLAHGSKSNKPQQSHDDQEEDTSKDYMYAVMIENVPKALQSNHMLRHKLNQLFPNQIRQVCVCLHATYLESLLQQRLKCVLQLESLQALKKGKPDKEIKPIQINTQTNKPLTVLEKLRFRGKHKVVQTDQSNDGDVAIEDDKVKPLVQTVDTISYYETELERLNREIDEERAKAHRFADKAHERAEALLVRGRGSIADLSSSLFKSTWSFVSKSLRKTSSQKEVTNKDEGSTTENRGAETNFSSELAQLQDEEVGENGGTGESQKLCEVEESEGGRESMKKLESDMAFNDKAVVDKMKPSTTAFVTFTSLRAKQAAIQCEISGKVDNMDVSPAPVPESIIWENIKVPLTAQNTSSLVAAACWIVGILFWAVPVTFVTGLANLNALLGTIGIAPLDETTFYYGLIGGMLPVIFLQILMLILYISIVVCAKLFIRFKSMPEVDAYTFYWHQLYQFANLWLILIGGSAFNQLDAILEDPTSIVNLLATALPGASTFFLNMVIMSTFLQQGLELSQFPAWIVSVIINMIMPENTQPQRKLDEKLKAPSIAWGQVRLFPFYTL